MIFNLLMQKCFKKSIRYKPLKFFINANITLFYTKKKKTICLFIETILK